MYLVYCCGADSGVWSNYYGTIIFSLTYRSVNCFDTCIVGLPTDPTIPLKCCANSILISETISTTVGEGYVIARLYSPNEDGQGVYRHNTFCK